MSDRSSTGPIPPAGPAPAQRREGVVLRDVAVHAEPRVLGTPAGRRRRAPPAPRAPADAVVVGDGGEPAAELGYGLPGHAGGHGEPAEAASAYQLGHRAGRAEAEAELSAARELALEAGFREGMARGEAEGRERGHAAGIDEGRRLLERDLLAAREATSARLALLDRVRTDLTAELGHRLARAEEEMVALSHAAICRILGERLVTPEGVAHHLAAALREADGGGLSIAGDRTPITVHLHPADLAALQGAPEGAAWFGAAGAAGAAIRWVPDDRLTIGGCLVRTAEGTLDARLEQQMEALRRTLLGEREAAAPGGPAVTPAGGEG
jgi:flagellar assembly protein FliH